MLVAASRDRDGPYDNLHGLDRSVDSVDFGDKRLDFAIFDSSPLLEVQQSIHVESSPPFSFSSSDVFRFLSHRHTVKLGYY